MLEVLDPGLLTTAQDGGRDGWRHVGVTRGGAADVAAWHIGNWLLGNAADACALELTLRGPRLRALAPCRVVLTGAPLPDARINAAPLAAGQVASLAPGDELVTGGMPRGCRAYLGVAGGFAFPPCLGSRASDVNAGLGPPPLQAGDRLPVGAAPDRGALPLGWGASFRAWAPDPRQVQVLRLLPGPDAARLTPDALRQLETASFTVGAGSSRVACRLAGPPLALDERQGATASVTLMPGALQLPPDGQLIAFGCEHPVTGGYPWVGQVAAADLGLLAQCRPGARLRFRRVTMAEALAARGELEAGLARLQRRIRARLDGKHAEEH